MGRAGVTLLQSAAHLLVRLTWGDWHHLGVSSLSLRSEGLWSSALECVLMDGFRPEYGNHGFDAQIHQIVGRVCGVNRGLR